MINDRIDPSALDADFGYDYPMGLDLRPKSDLHKTLIAELMHRVRDSQSKMSKRYPSWRELERTVTAYVPLDAEEERIKDNDSRKPVRVVVPFSYLMRDIMLTYMTAAFLDTPYHRYEGITPDDLVGAMLMEQVIDIQNQRFRNGLAYYVGFQDMLTYGFGVITPTWETETAFRTRYTPEVIPYGLEQIETGRLLRTKVEEVVAEGNRCHNIDPYQYYPDPNAPLHDPQQGEFIAWMQSDNYYSLLMDEASGGIFNARYLEGIDGRSSLNTSDSGREEKYDSRGVSNSTTNDRGRPMDKLVVYITLIPRQWKLGERDYPEKWMFVIVGDQVIVQAQPLNLNHNMYPVALGCPNFDGYTTSPISALEICYPLQEVADFVYSSRLAAVRKSLHDMFLVNPQMVYMPDVLNPRPNKIIRLRKSAWGQDLKNVLQQLNVNDVTGGHFKDISTVAELMERVTGAVDILQGMAPSGSNERVTAEQINSQRTAALSRLQKTSKLVSMQFMADAARLHAEHTQQFMEESTWIRITGQLASLLQADLGMSGRYQVMPWDLAVGYDVVMHDGSMSGSSYNNGLIQLFQQALQVPELYATYDINRIFGHMMRLNGVRNVDDFKRVNSPSPMGLDVQAVSNETAAQQEAAGNLVPLSQYQGATA